MTDETKAVALAAEFFETWPRYSLRAVSALAEYFETYAADRITALDKHRIERAGEVEQRLRECAANLGGCLESEAMTQAAATIAALKAQIERLTEREAQIELDGVRKGIEAALSAINDETPLTSGDTWGEGWADCRNAIRALDAEAIAKVDDGA